MFDCDQKKEFDWQRHLLYQILINQEKQMSALANAQAALAQLQTDVTALVNKPPSGVPEADVQALADGMTALDATIPKP